MSRKPSSTELKRTILYYPTINIPSQDWLKNAVLYWDEVSSIVPHDWRHDKTISVSGDIDLLQGEGLFRPIHPDQLLQNRGSWQAVHDMTDEFKSTVKSEHFKSILDRRRFSLSRIHNEKISKSNLIGKGARLHLDKTNYEIAEFLKRKKLAIQNNDNWQWFLVESTTALLYMSLLAKYIAATDRQHTVVGTDLRIYEKLNFQQSQRGEGINVINCNFKGLIPSPARGTSMNDIVKFKRKRQDNLIAFRRFLLDVQSKLSAATSNAEVKSILVSAQEDLKKGLKDMKAVFKDSKIDMVIKSLKSILNVQSSTVITGGAMFLNEKF
ncbi:MAG: hypothetical protein DI539_27510, partial [Flavobacterium psychrophilum]